MNLTSPIPYYSLEGLTVLASQEEILSYEMQKKIGDRLLNETKLKIIEDKIVNFSIYHKNT
jgi:hypothetical protein